MSDEINFTELARIYWEGRGIFTWRDWRDYLKTKHQIPNYWEFEKIFRPHGSRVNQLDDELAKITFDRENKVL